MSIISELEREKQIKSVELKEMLELKKIKKKKDVVINNITTNMSEFISRLTEKDATNSILTPESSNSSEQSEETENIIIDVKERLHETKKKLLPIDVEKDDTNL